MHVIVDRFYSNDRFTLGKLAEYFPEDKFRQKFLCFTLEDPHQDAKIMGHTRIPAGRYEIKLRPEGGKYQKYLTKFGGWQGPGMLHVTNVPGFEWILIHPGNTPADTEGCLLVGSICDMVGTIGNSSMTYARVYAYLADRIKSGEQCFITYEDNDQ